MALQINKTLHGVSIPDAYARIARFSGEKNRLSIIVEFFASATEAQKHNKFGAQIIDARIENGASLETMYNYLKTLPEFAGAQDCSEKLRFILNNERACNFCFSFCHPFLRERWHVFIVVGIVPEVQSACCVASHETRNPIGFHSVV